LQSNNSEAIDEQIKFLKACRGGNEIFLKYLQPFILKSEALVGKESAFVDIQLTEREFRNPPEDTQEQIFDSFKDYPSESLSYNGFWGYFIINLIKTNAIQSSYLAANTGNNNQSGLTCLDYALKDPSNDKDLVDSTVRRVLRSMCNPAPRGKRILFNSFVIGSSFWRWNFANLVSLALGREIEEVLSILNTEMFNQISELVHANDSWLSHKNVLAGVVLYREKYRNIKVGSFKYNVGKLRYMSPWKAIELQSPDENFNDLVLMSGEA